MYRRTFATLILLALTTPKATMAQVSSWTLLKSKVTVLIERPERNSLEVLMPNDAFIEDFHLETVELKGEGGQPTKMFSARIFFKSDEWAKMSNEYSRFTCWTQPMPFPSSAPDLRAMESLLKQNPIPLLLSISASNLSSTRSLFDQTNVPLAPTCKLAFHSDLKSYQKDLDRRIKKSTGKTLGPCRGTVGTDARATCIVQ